MPNLISHNVILKISPLLCLILVGKTYFEGQTKVGILPRFNADREIARAMRAKTQASSQPVPSSYTFTDLAQMVCQVSRGNRYADLDSDSDGMEEYEADLEEDAQEVGYASEPTVGVSDQVMQFADVENEIFSSCIDL